MLNPLIPFESRDHNGVQHHHVFRWCRLQRAAAVSAPIFAKITHFMQGLTFAPAEKLWKFGNPAFFGQKLLGWFVLLRTYAKFALAEQKKGHQKCI